MDCARAVSLKISTSQLTPNTIQNKSKFRDLVMRIELILPILIPRFSNVPRNTSINFRMFYIWYMFPDSRSFVAVPIKRADQKVEEFSLPLLIVRRIYTVFEHVSLIRLVTGIVTKPRL